MTFRLVHHAALRECNTFGVRAQATRLFEIDDASAIGHLFENGQLDAHSMVLGGGSNVLFAADPPSALLRLRCQDVQILEDAGDRVLVRAHAGLDWHRFVLWTLQHGLWGLENLALIPGTVGAAPIQNIGAYGVEVAHCIAAVRAWDRTEHVWRTLENAQCGFGYRDSLFKRQADAWIVAAVDFTLQRTPRPCLDYAGLREELADAGIHSPSAHEIAEAVIRIRRRKLPDPAVIGNAGSFFKNPIVPATLADALRTRHPRLPVHPAGHAGACKLSAAWLIETCGWKGHRAGDAGVSAQHALVLVNHGEATGAQLLALAQDIAASVHERFGVAIEPEPRIVGGVWSPPT